MTFGITSLTTLFSQPSVLAVGAGLLSGIVGGTTLMATGIVPLGGQTGADGAVALVACPGSEERLALVADGGRLLVTGRSADGDWYEVYLDQPGVDRAWAPFDALKLDASADSLPVADCDPPVPGALPSPRPSVAASIDVGSPEPSTSPSTSPAESASPGPSRTPGPTPRKSALPSVPPTATPAPPSVNPPPSVVPPPSVNPTPNAGPTLSGLTAIPQNFCQLSTSTISVTASDPDGVEYVRITYQPTGGPLYSDLPMVDQGSNVWAYGLSVQPGWNEGFISITVTAYDPFGAQNSLSNVDDTSDPSSLYVPTFC